MVNNSYSHDFYRGFGFFMHVYRIRDILVLVEAS
jgi:hypothetical protein